MINISQKLSIEKLHTAFVDTYEKDFNFAGEHHDTWEIGVIRLGNAGITSGTQVYDCSKDEIFIHQPGVFHNIWANKNEKVRILTISFTASGTISLIPHGKFKLNGNELTLVNMIEKEILSSRDNPNFTFDDDGQVLKNLIESLLLLLYRRKDETRQHKKEVKTNLFSDVATFLEQSVDDALTINDICAEKAIGRSTLKNLFKKYAGWSIMKYYNSLRVKRAVELMREGLNLSEVAEKMNFSSQNYFSSFFKRETGVTPSHYDY
jgi:AraC-like DNA-binding protein